ncbi:ATP-binding cassette domain-containing protein [Modestobacter lapidis]|nr:ATP-binding cassette domain-containing protein [Modestobacter lapidis]
MTDKVVDVSSLRFRYPGGPALLAVDRFEVSDPGLVAVMGQSGAGKSTFGALIGGQEQAPYEGSLKVFGHEWSSIVEDGRDADRQRHRRRIGYIPQGYGLLPNYTPEDMLMLDMGDAEVDQDARPGRADRALQVMGLAEMRDRPISELSGGQQQRVAIARMLAREVGLVVADEPTANLDVATTRDVLEALRQAGRRMPVIVITHDQWVADQCRWRLDLPDLATEGEAKRPETHGVRRVVDVSSAAPGSLGMWHVDQDGGIRHRRWPHGNRWSEWDRTELPEGARAASTGAGSRGEGDHEQLVADFDGRVWARQWRDGAWAPWAALPFDGVARSVAVSSAGAGHLERWIVRNDGELWHQWTEEGGWSGWARMAGRHEFQRITSVAAGSRGDGHHEIVAADTQGRAWHRWRAAGGWSDWLGLPVDDVRSVALSSGGPGHLEMWAVLSDGALQHSWSGPDGAWSAWHRMPPPDGCRIVSVAAGSRGDGNHELIAAAADGALLHRWWAGHGWSDWVGA